MASNVSPFLLWAFRILLFSLDDLGPQSMIPILPLQQTHPHQVDLDVLHKPRIHLV